MVRIQHVEQRQDVCIVEAEGRIAADTTTQLENALMTVLEEGTVKIIVDLKGVEYISSAGLRVFLTTLKHVKVKNGILILVNLITNVEKVFKLAGFTKIFTIMNNVEDALQSIDT